MELPLYLDDGIHLNKKGYDALETKLSNFFNKLTWCEYMLTSDLYTSLASHSGVSTSYTPFLRVCGSPTLCPCWLPDQRLEEDVEVVELAEPQIETSSHQPQLTEEDKPDTFGWDKWVVKKPQYRNTSYKRGRYYWTFLLLWFIYSWFCLLNVFSVHFF